MSAAEQRVRMSGAMMIIMLALSERINQLVNVVAVMGALLVYNGSLRFDKVL